MESKIEIKKIPWIIGFDYLRVIFIICVIYMHLHKFPPNQNNGWLNYFFYYVLCCSATPGFLLISLYLQGIKTKSNKSSYGDLANYVYLYIFWVACWCLLTKNYPEPSISGVINHLLQGGGWSFYFFAALIYTHIARIYVSSWKDKYLWSGLVMSLVITSTICCKLFMDHGLLSENTTYWWPVNFIPAPFIACLLERNREVIKSDAKVASKLCLGLFLSAIVVMFLEIRVIQYFSSDHSYQIIPEYLRASPWLFATCLMIYAHKIKVSNKVVGYFARNSLGIFCLHAFVLDGVGKLMKKMIISEGYWTFATLFLIIAGCALAAELFRKVLRSRLI